MRRIFVLFLLTAAALSAQRLFPRGIVNAASSMAPGLPGGAIARGSIFTVYGSNISPANFDQARTYPLSTTFNNVTIQITQGSNTVKAIPFAVRAGQINAIMPSNAPLGVVSVTVTYNSFTTNPIQARIVNSTFGILTVNSAGFGPALVQNAVPSGLPPLNSLTTPAKPGQDLVLYGTGLGPISLTSGAADTVTPPVGTLPTPVRVVVGGKSITPAYSGRLPGNAGTDQINFHLPDDVALGCWVPIYLVTDNSVTSNVATIAITADGSPCAPFDTSDPLSKDFANGGNLGQLQLIRTTIREDVGTPRSLDAVTDAAVLTLQKENGGQFAYNPAFSLPPAGTCTVYTMVGDLFGGTALPGTTPTGKFLAGGSSMTISGSGGNKVVQRSSDPKAYTQLGISITGSILVDSTMLVPGSYTVSVPGGTEVGGISASVTMPQPLTWTNRDQLTAINRSQGFTASWTGAPQGYQVFVTGGVSDPVNNATGVFYCVAPPGATSFTVPADVLANVPASRFPAYKTKSVVFVGMSPAQAAANTFSTSGITRGVALPVFQSGKSVTFQ